MRGQAGEQGLERQPAGIGLEPDALQGADRIAERQHVGALGAGGSQRAHDEQDGAAGVVAFGGLRQVGQHAGLGQVSARRAAACGSRHPTGRSARRCRAHRARLPAGAASRRRAGRERPAPPSPPATAAARRAARDRPRRSAPANAAGRRFRPTAAPGSNSPAAARSRRRSPQTRQVRRRRQVRKQRRQDARDLQVGAGLAGIIEDRHAGSARAVPAPAPPRRPGSTGRAAAAGRAAGPPDRRRRRPRGTGGDRPPPGPRAPAR